MAQVKKKAVQDAILRSAERLFATRGYAATTLSRIAAESNVGVGNIYSYFPSKLHLLYEVYRPWFERYLFALVADVRAERTARRRLHRLIVGLWHDLPVSNPRFANSLMEALASSEETDRKPSDLLSWTEEQLTALLRDILPPGNDRWLANNRLAHLLMMAQDGFIINHRWGESGSVDALADSLCAVLLRASSDDASPPAAARSRRRPARSTR